MEAQAQGNQQDLGNPRTRAMVRGEEIMPVPEGIISTSKVWSGDQPQTQEEVDVAKKAEEEKKEEQ
jgi:hypothetical protein